MIKLYQILYNVGRLTDAPGRRAFPFWGHWGSGQVCEGESTRSYEARFSPSRSPFPGTSLFCAVVWRSVLANACMLRYWLCTAMPMVCTGRKAVCIADLFLAVVVSLA